MITPTLTLSSDGGATFKGNQTATIGTASTVNFGIKSKYTVKYGIEGKSVTGEPEFMAVDEGDALKQFNDAVSLLLNNQKIKILAVTHHLR